MSVPRPLGDKITVRDLEKPEKIGVIFIPDGTKTQSTICHSKALVVAAGPKAVDECPVGSIVHLHEAWGDKVTHEGIDYRIGRIRDINGVLIGERISHAQSLRL